MMPAFSESLPRVAEIFSTFCSFSCTGSAPYAQHQRQVLRFALGELHR